MSDPIEIELQKRWLNERRASSELRGFRHYLLFLRLQKAYQFAALHCGGKRVLDLGCGWGFGTSLLSGQAKGVTAVDSRSERIDYCEKNRTSQNISFRKASWGKESFPGEPLFDVIVSFQFIEHIKDANRYLADLTELLVRGGILFITTPNRSYRLLPFQRPWNPDHVKEYSIGEFRKVVSSVFKRFEIFGVYGSDEINALEYERVRGIQSMVIFHRKPKAARDAAQEIYDRYSLDDFTVGMDMKKSLDFLAICHKD